MWLACQVLVRMALAPSLTGVGQDGPGPSLTAPAQLFWFFQLALPDSLTLHARNKHGGSVFDI